MQLRVSAPDDGIRPDDIDRIRRDLEKIDRRLVRYDQVFAEIHVNGKGTPNYDVTLKLEYGRHHLIAKATGPDIGQTVREAREEILRQINDRAPGSHSSYSKRT